MASLGYFPLGETPYFLYTMVQKAIGILFIVEFPTGNHYSAITINKYAFPYSAFIKHTSSELYYLFKILGGNHYLGRGMLFLVVQYAVTYFNHFLPIWKEGINDV